MKVIITGGYGFIGSAMIRKLIADTDFYILNLDKLTYAANEDSLQHIEGNSRYSFKNADICDYDTVYELLKMYKPDAVINFAAESHVDRSIKSAAPFMSTNIFGVYSLLNAVFDFWNSPNCTNKQFKFLQVSTDEVYGDLPLDQAPVTEEASFAPNSPYAASKASAEHLVRAWNKTYGLPTLITNCSNNYGPWQHREKLIPKVICSVLHGERIPVYGDGLQIRDWLHVDDHVDAIFKVLQDGVIGSSYNVGANCEVTNIELVEMICKLLDELVFSGSSQQDSFKKHVSFVNDRLGHDRRYALDATKINKELNWKPRIELERGLRETVKWYLNSFGNLSNG